MDTNRTCMDTHKEKRPVFGEAIQAAMAKRGCHLTLFESQQFARALLDLISMRALVFFDADGNEIPWPETRSHKAEVPE